MSTKLFAIRGLPAAIFLFLQIFTNAAAQQVTIAIGKDDNKRSATVSGEFTDGKPTRNLSFNDTAAGAAALGERISDVALGGHENSALPFRRMTSFEYLAGGDIKRWSYNVNLAPAAAPAAAAHASWINRDTGILMLDDLLPLALTGQGKVPRITLPAGWKAFYPPEVSGTADEAVTDLRQLVVPVGTGWREVPSAAAGTDLKLLISGEWLFTDSEAAEMASEVYGHYQKLFGGAPGKSARVVIAKFPTNAAVGNWQAETRGRTVTIISSDMNFRTQSRQRLHEQLRHELFHLWMPNGVNLTGRYDWFYEGFALYQSLKTAVLLNRIRFEDFLDTLSRAHDLDTAQTRRYSLLDASANRWSGAQDQVYARGMIVAFLCDLKLLSGSSGKRSVEDILAELFRRHRPPAPPAVGNDSVLQILSGYPETLPVIEKYVRGDGAVDWTADIELAGIQSAGEGRHSMLKVVEKPRGRQKALLNKLGYNSWRKLGEDRK